MDSKKLGEILKSTHDNMFQKLNANTQLKKSKPIKQNLKSDMRGNYNEYK